MSPLLALAALAAPGPETQYFGFYLEGAKVGYATQTEGPATVEGRPGLRSVAHMELTQTLGGVSLKVVSDDVTLMRPDHRPVRETLTTTVGKTVDRTTAAFGAKTVEIDGETGGKRTHQSIPIPEGDVFGGDLGPVIRAKLAPGKSLTFWSFEVNGSVFAKTELKMIGPASFQSGGKAVAANLTEMTSDGDTARVFTSDAGALLRMEFSTRQLLQAEPKAAALSPVAKGEDAPDLIVLNRLQAIPAIQNGARLTALKLRVVGEDLSKIPSDEFQTVTKDGDGWIVDVHPPKLSESVPTPLGTAVAGREAWIAATPFLSADDPKIREAAKKAIGTTGDAPSAIFGIRRFVSRHMKPQLEFGDVRDAADILKNPHGKCTEYAVLTTALLRAAGVPARIVSGLVTATDDGAFYYHSWAEAWDGHRWIGVDSAFETDQVSAAHIKLVQGDANSGFRIDYPRDPRSVKISVISLSY